MKKPATLADFISLIETMEHRERFVFELSDNDQPATTCTHYEIYSTELMPELGERRQNVLYQQVSIGGKYDSKFNLKCSRLMRITSNSWIDKWVYSKIA